jgi:hypothetical protein
MAALEEAVRLRREVDDLRAALEQSGAELAGLHAAVVERGEGSRSRGAVAADRAPDRAGPGRLADAGAAGAPR